MTKSPLDILHAVLRDNPKASRKEAFETLRKRLTQTAINAIIEDWFSRNYGKFDIEQIGRGRMIVPADRRPVRSREEVRQAAANLADRVRQIVLMDATLPCGKRVRHATFGECARAGSWFSAIGSLGKANEAVDKKLTEKDLQHIWLRFQKERAA